MSTEPKINKGYHTPSLQDALETRMQLLEIALERGDIPKARSYCRALREQLPAAFKEAREGRKK